MAGKKKPTQPAFQPAEFINYTLTKDDKVKFSAWRSSQTAEDLLLMVEKAIEDGYDLTLKHDSYSGAEAAFMKQHDAGKVNSGFILSSRASNMTAAIQALFFRHYVLFEGDWPTDIVVKTGLDDE